MLFSKSNQSNNKFWLKTSYNYKAFCQVLVLLGIVCSGCKTDSLQANPANLHAGMGLWLGNLMKMM